MLPLVTGDRGSGELRFPNYLKQERNYVAIKIKSYGGAFEVELHSGCVTKGLEEKKFIWKKAYEILSSDSVEQFSNQNMAQPIGAM